MRRLPLVLALLLLGSVLGIATLAPRAEEPAKPAKPMAQESLYKRLGGYDALAAVTDDFVGRLATDPLVGRFFVGLSNDSKGKTRQHIVDQLCEATGGPCVYTGRDMKTTHEGLAITQKDWDVSIKHLVATLDKFKVPQKEKDEVLAMLSALKGDIVEK